MSAPIASSPGARWADAWPDGLAFAGGLSLAWFLEWKTADLVWSLWLSSLIVGYTMIVWTIFRPIVFVTGKMAGEPGFLGRMPWGQMVLGGGAVLIGALFLLAFFTFHFGMFHFVHSVFLNSFFPAMTEARTMTPGFELYWHVFKEYWPFVLVAAIAERQAFRLAAPEEPAPDTSVKAADIAARLVRNKQSDGMTGMMAPYRNVVRLHLLIFFFAFAHYAKLENYLVYAVVYAVYFFPWRLLKGGKTTVTANSP